MNNTNEKTNEVYDNLKLEEAVRLFNQREWYLAHDAFEEIWHETYGPERIIIQALVQISVAEVHLESGNTNGAKILFGEGLGRLKSQSFTDMGFDIELLIELLQKRLSQLQKENDPDSFTVPFLSKITPDIVDL
tara:strand:- start:107 stop:508 length:402 start_codon:yes stop_codon:yes gene_type:complete